MNKSSWALGAIIALTAIFVIPSIYTPTHVWAIPIHGHHGSTCSASVARNGSTISTSFSPRSGSCSTGAAATGAVSGIGFASGKSSCTSISASDGTLSFQPSSGKNGAVSCSTHSP